MKPREVKHPPLGYKDEKFLESEDARPLRILAEYLQPLRNFRASRSTTLSFSSGRPSLPQTARSVAITRKPESSRDS